jgi:acyl-CoA thioester hydrolase
MSIIPRHRHVRPSSTVLWSLTQGRLSVVSNLLHERDLVLKSIIIIPIFPRMSRIFPKLVLKNRRASQDKRSSQVIIQFIRLTDRFHGFGWDDNDPLAAPVVIIIIKGKLILAEKTFSKAYQVRWVDLDPNGHMRNSAYDDYAADARLHLLAEHGFSHERLTELGLGPVIMRQEARYYRELRLGEGFIVVVLLAGMSPDGSRWKIQHKMLEAGGEQAALLSVEGTWLDLLSRKVVAPPPDLLAISEGLERTPNFEELHSLIRINRR